MACGSVAVSPKLAGYFGERECEGSGYGCESIRLTSLPRTRDLGVAIERKLAQQFRVVAELPGWLLGDPNAQVALRILSGC